MTLFFRSFSFDTRRERQWAQYSPTSLYRYEYIYFIDEILRIYLFTLAPISTARDDRPPRHHRPHDRLRPGNDHSLPPLPIPRLRHRHRRRIQDDPRRRREQDYVTGRHHRESSMQSPVDEYVCYEKWEDDVCVAGCGAVGGGREGD